jgi:tetratricopeptide (TPR) repeat protein
MNAIAGLYGKLGKFEEEIAWAKKAIATDETFYLAYINYGNAQTYLQRVQEAREAFEKARRLAPRDPLPVYRLGVLAEDQHKLSEATSFYEESVALDPKFENGYFNLAAMYANAKRFDEAVAALRKVLELNPQSTDAKAMLRQIEKERKR